MAVKFHDLGQILVKWGTNSFTHFTGDGILWAPIEDRIAKMQGARGEVTFSAKFDELSEVTMVIMPGSPNQAIINLMQGAGGSQRPFGTFVATDPLGQSNVSAPAATLRRRPDWNKPEEAAPTTIVLDLANARVDYGPGAVAVG